MSGCSRTTMTVLQTCDTPPRSDEDFPSLLMRLALQLYNFMAGYEATWISGILGQEESFQQQRLQQQQRQHQHAILNTAGQTGAQTDASVNLQPIARFYGNN